MGRFVIATRLKGSAQRGGGWERPREVERLLACADVVARREGEGRRQLIVFDADPEEVRVRSGGLGSGTLLEPLILHHTLAPSGVGVSPPATGSVEVRDPGTGAILSFTLVGDPRCLEQGQVVLYLAAGKEIIKSQRARIDSRSGKIQLTFGERWKPALFLFLSPFVHWSLMIPAPAQDAMLDVPLLPQTGPLGWWHHRLGVTEYDEKRGAGIRVAVIDTGVGPHRYLSHVTDAGAFQLIAAAAGSGEDVQSHGTHVAGIIGARPTPDSGDFAGVAPGVDLIGARVFDPSFNATQWDLVEAIDQMASSEVKADLINLSLGSETASEIVRDAIEAALDSGALCICAAGNGASSVEFPAAFPETVAVSALGLTGWGPSRSISGQMCPEDPEKHAANGLYLASFSCFGPELDCCGPGVGIISTVPERGVEAAYAAMDGSSMASPAVCGILAAQLAESAEYKSLPRGRDRADFAASVLRSMCRDVGLGPEFQGVGLPRYQSRTNC